jgi:hypothetical protein
MSVGLTELTFSSCYRRPCFERILRDDHPPPTKRVYRLRDRKARSSSKEFKSFSKLPKEIQMRIWEMTMEDGRIVTVGTAFGKEGLLSLDPVPSALHVCADSRAVGLKHCALHFAATQWSRCSDEETTPLLPAQIYFNFDRDTLYFPQDWNHGVYAEWSCLSYLSDMTDLQRVQSVAVDIKANVCSDKTTGHVPDFSEWTALKSIYLVLEEPNMLGGRQKKFCELHEKEYSSFVKCYHKSDCVVDVPKTLNDAETLENIRNVRMLPSISGHQPQLNSWAAKVYPVRAVGL